MSKRYKQFRRIRFNCNRGKCTRRWEKQPSGSYQIYCICCGRWMGTFGAGAYEEMSRIDWKAVQRNMEARMVPVHLAAIRARARIARGKEIGSPGDL